MTIINPKTMKGRQIDHIYYTFLLKFLKYFDIEINGRKHLLNILLTFFSLYMFDIEKKFFGNV